MHTFLAFSSGSSRNTNYSCYVSRFPTLVWKLQSSSFICNMELHINAYIRVHNFLSALPGTCFYSLVFERRSCCVVQAGDWNSLEPGRTWTQDRLVCSSSVWDSKDVLDRAFTDTLQILLSVLQKKKKSSIPSFLKTLLLFLFLGWGRTEQKCGGQRTALWTWVLSFPLYWVPRISLDSLRLHNRCSTCWAQEEQRVCVRQHTDLRAWPLQGLTPCSHKMLHPHGPRTLSFLHLGSSDTARPPGAAQSLFVEWKPNIRMPYTHKYSQIKIQIFTWKPNHKDRFTDCKAHV